jgi:integrase
MPKRSEIAITKTKIDNLAQGACLWDSQLVGFGVKANANTKSYKLKYRFKGRQRMMHIGVHGSPYTVEMARKAAMAALVKLEAGVDPAAEKKLVGETVAQLCDEYILNHATAHKKPSSTKGDAANIKNHLKPLLGDRLIKDIAPNDIEKFMADVQQGKTAPKDPKAVQKAQKGGKAVTGGKGVANRCLSLLSKMFNLAERWGYRSNNTNPVRGATKYKENPKERYLTSVELQRLWQYLDQMERDGIHFDSYEDGKSTGAQTEATKSHYAMYSVACIRLLILTGARLNEIMSLKWDMVDLTGSVLNLPDSKTGKKTIQLSDTAIEVLKALPKVKDNPYVIVGGKSGKHLKNLRKPWIAICKATNLGGVRIHDLRHSFASFAAAQGQPLLVIGKLLGHKNPATTQRYVHLTDNLLKTANQAISEEIGLIVGKK